MHVFTMPADRWDEANPDKRAILHLIQKHQRCVPDLNKLKAYYKGYYRYGKQLFHRKSCNI